MKNRREFLTTAAAGLSTALSASRVMGANDRITGAFIGVGVMGSENLNVAMEHGTRIGAVCDVYQPHLERAGALARRKGNTPKEVKDFREILADRSIDFVCISTPDHWHPYITVEACKAGKDVYVEKPACVVADEGQKMIAAARKYGRIVQAGTWQRSGDHFQKACEMVRTGVLGKVTVCKTWMYQNMPQAGIGNPPEGQPPAGLDWDLWLGPSPERRFQPNRFGVYPNAYSYFRFFWDYAGGILTDSGIHMIDTAHMALGDPMPTAVAAMGGKFWLTDDTETPDTMMVAFDYPGMVASWEHRTNNMENASRVMSVTFHGTRGTLYLDRAMFRLTPEKGSDLEPMEMKRGIDGHPAHWTNFLECVKTRKRPNSEIETCVRSTTACLLGNVSLRSKLRLDWDDQAKTVLQPGAAPFLHREYRAPWKLEV
ncbi:MAG: Gfo/Idh/MocA family oxidoreductase [Bryobacteraceae bacterium]